MSSLYRSQTMSYVRLLLTEDSAVVTVRALGSWGHLHIVDLNASNAAAALSERVGRLKKRIALCQYWEKRLQSLRELMPDYGVEPLLEDEVAVSAAVEAAQGDVLEAVSGAVEPLEASLSKNILFRREQRLAVSSMTEQLHVLHTVIDPQGTSRRQRREEEKQTGADDDDSAVEEKKERDETAELRLGLGSDSSSSLGGGFQSSHVFSSSLHGTIATAAVPLLERLVFRTSRGNAILRIAAIDAPLADPQTEQAVSKSVFTLLHVGEEMEKRLHRVLHAVGATEYDIPIGWKDRLRLVRELQVRREDTRRVLRQTEAEIADALAALAWDEATQSSPYWDWMTSLQRERGVCEMLRRCEQTERQSRMLIAEAWLQSEKLSELQRTLAQAVQQTSLQQAALQLLPLSASSAPPPTCFPTNAFTASFQAIVDTYGVPRYQEVNPGLFTIVSFPFLFGVMYGDVGHGTLLTLSAAVMLLWERRLEEQQRRGQLSDILQLVFGGRYLMLMMGLFAVYCGLVYNDCFSIPLPLFASSWRWPRDGAQAEATGRVYPFGVDWRWYHTGNQLAFFNSMKMKMSVCIGVVQMLFGIALSACNCLHFKETAALWLEFLPRLLFLLCTFGYMIFLILYKWTVDWTQPHAPPPVNLIQTMIQMFLQPGSVDRDAQLYAGQAVVQSLLLTVALLSVPVMLLGVPLVERGEHLRRAKEKEEEEAVEEEQQPLVVRQDDGEEQPLSSSRRRKAHSRARKGEYDAVRSDSEDEDDEKRLRDEEKHSARIPTSHSSDSISRSASAPHAQAPLPVDATVPVPAAAHTAAANSTAVSGAVSASAAYSFSDSLISQSIHTIEFVLGCVSNTASYLRLWALSLAHAQLAEVFWSKMIQQYGLQQRSPALLALGVAVWTAATFAVLLCMDVLECFLHALRLHWVESAGSRAQAGRDCETTAAASLHRADRCLCLLCCVLTAQVSEQVLFR